MALRKVLLEREIPAIEIPRVQGAIQGRELRNISYEIETRDPVSGQTRSTTVCARVFPTRTECGEYFRTRLLPLVTRAAGRPELAPFSTPIAWISSLNMAVSVFPIDGDLPALIATTDPRRMLEVLRDKMPDIRECHVEIAQYRRRHRCVLRYRVERDSEEEAIRVFGKVTGAACDLTPLSAIESLRARANGASGEHALRIPDVIGASTDNHLSLLAAVPGKPRFTRFLKKRVEGRDARGKHPSLEAAIDMCASAASTLHHSGIPLGRSHTITDELRALRRSIGFVEPITPELAEPLLRWYEQLAIDAESSDALPLRFSHGDFSYSQFLFDGPVAGLVDFDNICQAEPARDLGQFLAYLRLGFRKVVPSAPVSLREWICSRFVESYLAASPDSLASSAQFRARVSLYQEATLLRLSVKSWQKFKVERLDHALTILRDLETRSADVEATPFFHGERENRRIVG